MNNIDLEYAAQRIVAAAQQSNVDTKIAAGERPFTIDHKTESRLSYRINTKHAQAKQSADRQEV